jgi:hypothetical protein
MNLIQASMRGVFFFLFFFFLLTDIWIPEYESLVQLVLHPVHLAANDAEQGLAVDKYLDAVLLHGLVESARLVYVLQVVGQSAAAPVAHANLDELRVWLIKQRA